MYCVYGAEHSVSLCFKDVAHFSPVGKLIREDQFLYRVFGSGLMHAPHAIFKKMASDFNNRVEIGMIKGVTRSFAFYFMSFHRLL